MHREREVLEVLNLSDPRMVTEQALQNEINVGATTAMDRDQLKTLLASLRAKGQAVDVPTEETDREGNQIIRWRITHNGKGRLRA